MYAILGTDVQQFKELETLMFNNCVHVRCSTEKKKNIFFVKDIASRSQIKCLIHNYLVLLYCKNLIK